MSIHYETSFTNIGGRTGESVGREAQFKMQSPDEAGNMEAGSYNPEQLFAAALASCYNGAFLYHMEEAGKKSDVHFTVTVYLEDDPNEEGTLRIRALCSVNASELTQEEVRCFFEKAKHTSPYTKLFRAEAVLENDC